MLGAEIKRHRFTAEQYHKMAEVGLLREDDRVELIRGEIADISPIGWPQLPPYAAVGIPEALIVDLQNRKVEVQTNPKPDGYQDGQEFGPGRLLRSETVEGVALPVDAILG